MMIGAGAEIREFARKAVTRLFRFGLVGLLAFGVHWTTVVTIVAFTGINPLVANVAGFLVAFSISYAGHKNWTFADRDASHRMALVRFFAVALSGFAINESTYFVLLRILQIDYRIGLVFAIGLAAASTYMFSHFWAFKTAENDGRLP